MMDFLLDYRTVATFLLIVAVSYPAFVRPYLVKKKLLNTDTLELIDYACERGVGYAEQLYKTDESIDRQKLAIDFAFEMLKKAGIAPDQYLNILKGVIEDKVRKLPKTKAKTTIDSTITVKGFNVESILG